MNTPKTKEELDAIGADIRNKLTPFKTLIDLIRIQRETSDLARKEKLQEYINQSIHQADISIEYLKNLL
jgi:ABC-type transport system involved in Fe-S cluster assembly fused permease/ATPase subunit